MNGLPTFLLGELNERRPKASGLHGCRCISVFSNHRLIMKRLILLLALVLVFDAHAGKKNKAAMKQGQEDDAEGNPIGAVHVYKTVAGRELQLHVLNPADWKASDQRPAIVFFHGGGWEKGRPAQFNAQSEYLITRGMVCIQAEYRLISNNRQEAPVHPCEDAKSAMRWVRSHAAALGIDPNRIASGGGSAGGHLAAFVGMVEGTDDAQDDLQISCRPSAMVLYNPALLHGADVAPMAEDSRRPPFSPELTKRYEAVSPYLHVSQDDPPGIILVGSKDGVLPPAALKGFLALCQTAKVRMESVVYPGEGHSFFGLRRSPDRFYDTTLEMDKFLASLGWISGPPTLTREQVKQMGEGITLVPNKTQRADAKVP